MLRTRASTHGRLTLASFRSLRAQTFHILRCVVELEEYRASVAEMLVNLRKNGIYGPSIRRSLRHILAPAFL